MNGEYMRKDVGMYLESAESVSSWLEKQDPKQDHNLVTIDGIKRDITI